MRQTWMEVAAEGASSEKMLKYRDSHADVLQTYAILAVAEAINRLADAVAAQERR